MTSQTTRRKPTKWSDCNKNLNRIETREWQSLGYTSRPNGRSAIDIKCPFCSEVSEAKIWSLRGGGKRCENPDCGAMHGSHKHSYRLKDEFAFGRTA